MSIGFGILLFVIGAILAFALNLTVDWIDLQLVGYILMGAGVVIVIIGIVLLARRRRSVATSQTSIDPATGDRVTRTERSAPDDEVY
ncbi:MULTISPECIES: DUF6458 family protein [Agromyces]|uniref:DUF6458 family protein n=1 Tax=Agromyces soli TaxID=659012 RepID=A0ABY4APN2_9MICO|nr:MULTISPECIES: DUF6458 family protein [Agromyces]MCD1569869.1 DUF6458 family protein [Agromyces mediolanus]UOE25112.1 DUF6458 family protein [Agromyces soli]GLU89675.1 hypothetical protein Agsp01_19300 [Agromyces sp. NBRC 114283]